MKRPITRSALLLSALAACSSSSGAEEPHPDAAYADADELATLSGTFASPAPEPWGDQVWATREFHFDRGTWSLRFELGLDPQLSRKVFRFRTEGTYDLLAPSSVVAHAYEAVFHEERKLVTLLTDDPALAQGFGLSGCGLEVGVERDVSVEGCALWKPVAVCGDDHDLLAHQKPDRVFFGVRPADNDMCTPDRRPRALLPAVVRR